MKERGGERGRERGREGEGEGEKETEKMARACAAKRTASGQKERRIGADGYEAEAQKRAETSGIGAVLGRMG
eukprot:3940462-Rhodomonas_salina.2